MSPYVQNISSRPLRGWLALPTALLMAFVVLLGGTAAPASAEPGTGYAYGWVHSPNGSSSGVVISAFTEDPRLHAAAVPAATTTITAGTYFTMDVPGDTEGASVWFRVEKPGFVTSVVGPVTVYAGYNAYVGDIDLSADPALLGTLSGVVHEPSGETVGEGRGHVEIYQVESDASLTSVRTTHTDDQGVWSVPLSAGTFLVEVSDDEDEFATLWAGGTSEATATRHAVTAQHTTKTADVRFVDGAMITGTVRDASGKPLRDISVVATAGSETGFWPGSGP